MDSREAFLRFKRQLPDMQRKVDKIERMAKACDPRMIDEMTGINNFLEVNKPLSEKNVNV